VLGLVEVAGNDAGDSRQLRKVTVMQGGFAKDMVRLPRLLGREVSVI